MAGITLDHMTARIGAVAEDLIAECDGDDGCLKLLASVFALQAAKIEKAVSGPDSAAGTFEAIAETIRTDPDAVNTTTMHVVSGPG
jgi:hypothetical protein